MHVCSLLKYIKYKAKLVLARAGTTTAVYSTPTSCRLRI